MQDGSVEGYTITDEQAAQLQRSRGSNPLFRGLPTGTYSYRYRDVGTSIVDSLTDPTPTDPSDPIAYRETTAVENGAMTLLSKQVGVESPTTGAKGRAREREMRRRGGRRVIMPSQGLVEAARRASFPLTGEHDFLTTSNGNLSYPEPDVDGHRVKAGRPRRLEEMLLVGCGPESERRREHESGREDGKVDTAAYTSSSESDKNAFADDGKWVSGAEGVRLLASTPTSSFLLHGGVRGRERECLPEKNIIALSSAPPIPRENLALSARIGLEKGSLLEENARLREEIARLRLEQEEEENARLKSEIARLRTERYKRKERQAALDANRSRSRSRSRSADAWASAAGLGAGPRRTANRGGRAGASVMSQEVLVEGYAGGKGRAREREEKRRTHHLTRVLPDSENDDKDKNGVEYGNLGDGKVISSSDEEYRGRLKGRDEAAAAALANLPEDVRKKYAEDRPSRIWREHSHEILVESDLTGARGRRREVNMKREEPARFMPSQEMRDAAAAMEAGTTYTKSP